MTDVGDPLFEFTLDKITYLSPTECDSVAYIDSELPPGGSYVVLNFTFNTFAGTPQNESYLSAGNFYTAGKSGRVNPSAATNYAAYSCKGSTGVGAGPVTNPFPNSVYEARTTVVVTEPTGVIGYKWDGKGGPVSWEWNYQIP